VSPSGVKNPNLAFINKYYFRKIAKSTGLFKGPVAVITKKYRRHNVKI